MNAYWPTDSAGAIAIPSLLLAAPILGLLVTWIESRWLAWLQVIVLTGLVERLAAGQPAGFRMAVLCLATWLSFKALASVEARKAGERLPATLPWLGFAALWFGMRPSVFAGIPRPRADAARFVARGSLWFAVGLAGMLLAHALVAHHSPLSTHQSLLSTVLISAIALISLSLMFHFGFITILAGIWRAVGYPCRPICHAPLLSQSLAEFWGQRWNQPFTELIAQAIYRPLLPRAGKPLATLAGFFFSGLWHEAAISLPVQAGYGLPTLYFLLQGVLVLVERRLPLTGWPARLWTLAWLVLPLPLLFHPWFLAGTIWPLVGLG